jgi:hypothetical protein
VEVTPTARGHLEGLGGRRGPSGGVGEQQRRREVVRRLAEPVAVVLVPVDAVGLQARDGAATAAADFALVHPGARGGVVAPELDLRDDVVEEVEEEVVLRCRVARARDEAALARREEGRRRREVAGQRRLDPEREQRARRVHRPARARLPRLAELEQQLVAELPGPNTIGTGR